MTHKQFEASLRSLVRVAIAISLRMRCEYRVRVPKEDWTESMWREQHRANIQSGEVSLVEVATTDYLN